MLTSAKLPAVPLRHELKRQETLSGGRSSLDIPRKPPVWDDHGGTSQCSQPILGIPCTTKNEFDRLKDLPRQRPLSTGPSSRQQHLSTPSIQHSQSPSKSIYLTPHPPNSSAPAPSSLTTMARPSRSQYGEPTTQGYLSTNSSRPELPQYPFVPGRPLHRVTSSKEVPNEGAKRIVSLTPPINRVDKPKIPLKPPLDSRLTGKTSLEPGETSDVNRISPFSTPPSSEGSPGGEIPYGKQATNLVSDKISKIINHENYFPPPPIHYSSDERLQGHPGGSFRGRRQTDPRLNGFSQDEQPPGLPPRRDSNNIPAAPVNRAEKVSSSQPREGYVGKHRTLTTTFNPATSVSRSSANLLPPPKRISFLPEDSPPSSTIFDTARKPESKLLRVSSEKQHVLQAQIRPINTPEGERLDYGDDNTPAPITDYPDVSQVNRRPPHARDGIQQIETKYDTRLFDICGRYVCASGYLTRVWDVVSGDLILNLSPGEKEVKVTSMAFKPGATAEGEGLRVWLGTNYGDIQEIDIPAQTVVQTRSGAHGRREIIRIYRHRNSMWSLDDDGNLLVWPPDDRGLPTLQLSPVTYKVSKGHTFSIIIKDHLWLATGKEIWIFDPCVINNRPFHVSPHALSYTGTGEITSGAVISSQLQKVYFGHTDGKVTIYSTTEYTCLGIINVSVYKISSLAGAGFYLWAGYNTGMIYVYDTRTQPWLVKKDWRAHNNPIAGILVDRSSVWKLGRLQVASIGLDNAIKIWDGMLEEDWLGELD